MSTIHGDEIRAMQEARAKRITKDLEFINWKGTFCFMKVIMDDPPPAGLDPTPMYFLQGHLPSFRMDTRVFLAAAEE